MITRGRVSRTKVIKDRTDRTDRTDTVCIAGVIGRNDKVNNRHTRGNNRTGRASIFRYPLSIRLST